MYPDHFHLVSYFDSEAPRFGIQLPPGWQSKGFFGRLFTFEELALEYGVLKIGDEIAACRERGEWVGSYIEAHIWNRKQAAS